MPNLFIIILNTAPETLRINARIGAVALFDRARFGFALGV